jgi:hypothetical protein
MRGHHRAEGDAPASKALFELRLPFRQGDSRQSAGRRLEVRCVKSFVFLIFAALFGCSGVSVAQQYDWTGTVYIAAVSSERTWQHVIKDPFGADYADAYLFAAALSRPYASFLDDRFRLEAEGQLVYNFGDQDHWELNSVPVIARWRRFPWSEHVATSVAFGLGLSYATEVPEVEVALEGESHRWLIYWVLELTAGPPHSAWEVSLRLHHRSVAWGLMGDNGGANAMGLGLRYRF